MPLYFRGHHVTAKEYRLACELSRLAPTFYPALDEILAMTPATWHTWSKSHWGDLGAPDDSWGGPYAAAVYRTQEQQQAEANTRALETLLDLIGTRGFLLVPKVRPKRKPRRTHARRTTKRTRRRA